MIKYNKQVLVKLLIVTIIFIVLTMILTISNMALQANTTGSQLSTSTQAALNQSMSSNTFVHGGSTFNINQYYSHLYGNQGRPANSPRVILPSGQNTNVSDAQFNITDPITSLIPVAVFQELTVEGVRTFMGREWGVIIDVVIINDIRNFFVQVIDINTINNLHTEQQIYAIEIRPLFEVQFAWITENSGQGFANWAFNFIRNGPVGLYAIPQMRTNFMMLPGNIPSLIVSSDFENSRRNYIANFAFGAILENEQNANPEHNKYIPNSFDHRLDFGHYFVGTDLHFVAFDIDDLENARRRYEIGSINSLSAVQTFAGVLSLLDPTPISGVFLTIWDVVDFSRNLTPSAVEQPLEANFNHSSALLERFWFSHSDQLLHYGQLLKDAATLPSDSALALTLHGNQDTFAKGIFDIARQADLQNNRWISRLNIGFTFDIHRYNSNNLVATAQGGITEVLGDERGNYRPITTGQPTRVYNHSQNTSRFRFTAPAAGLYSFDFINPNHRSRFNNFNKREIHLRAGQTFYFRLDYLHDDVSIFYFLVERIDPSSIHLELNQTRNITEDLLSGSREFTFFNDTPRFVRITITGTMLWDRQIVVRDRNRNQIEMLDGMGMAESSRFSSEVTVFLPNIGNFFIDTNQLGGTQVFIRIEEVRSHDVDFSAGVNTRLNLFNASYGPDMVRLTLSQNARFNISIPNTANLIFIIYRFDGTFFDFSQSHWFFNGGSRVVDLPAGTYYIGYFNAPRGWWAGNINITRVAAPRILSVDIGLNHNALSEEDFELLNFILYKERNRQEFEYLY